MLLPLNSTNRGIRERTSHSFIPLSINLLIIVTFSSCPFVDVYSKRNILSSNKEYLSVMSRWEVLENLVARRLRPEIRLLE